MTNHEVSPLEYGPLRESMQLSGGLDYYKPTMGQLQYEKHQGAEVTFTFHNRGEQRLLDYLDISELQQRFDTLGEKGWEPEELDYYRTLQNTKGEPMFSEDFLDYLAGHGLPHVDMWYDEAIDDIAIQSTGAWPLVSQWETIVMAKVNEAYFENYVRAHDIDIFELYNEGDRRLSAKIETLKQHPDIKFSDFGTRRHFSLAWQRHVDERLKAECPDNFVGTSNVALARELDVKPIGTFAHEMPMVYAGIANALGKDVRASHHEFLEDWFERYGEDLSIALTDTFGSQFFFSDFTPEQATQWHALRHDSGDPIDFGERAIRFYEELDVDPLQKTIVFSDGLDIDDILKLHEHFKGRINMVFGWGTTLTNDLGLKPLNIVMKATHVRLETGEEADLVKLSDNEGKHTGPQPKVEEYQDWFAGHAVLTA